MPWVIVTMTKEPEKLDKFKWCELQEDFNKKPFYTGPNAIRAEKQAKIDDYEHECIAEEEDREE